MRFWRIKKGHLPGRPVQLNEYSRGFVFTTLSFVPLEPGRGTTRVEVQSPKGTFLVGSTKGVLLRIDGDREILQCAYQLHSGGISSLMMTSGFAVTGSTDLKLRIWPLDFTDYLLEAAHESNITCIHGNDAGKLLVVGTVSGTLGVLTTATHSFATILRSHTQRIHALIPKPSTHEEFLTLSADHSIRIWDTVSLAQKYEFNTPNDEPVSAAFHPVSRTIAVGFTSGALRIFDIHTTSLVCERSAEYHDRISCLLFSKNGNLLFSGGQNGQVTVFDTLCSYLNIRTITIFEELSPLNAQRNDSHVFMALNCEGSQLACVGNTIGTLTIIDTVTLQPFFRLANAVNTASIPIFHPLGSPVTSGERTMAIESCVGNLLETSRLQASLGDVVGLCFSNSTHEIRDNILIAGKKCLMCIPFHEKSVSVPELTAGFDVFLSERSLRRLEFGSPRSFYKDAHSGLFFMSVVAALPGGFSNIDQSTLPSNAIAMFGIKFKSASAFSMRSPFSFSAVQLYPQSEGGAPMVGLAPCSACHKIISADEAGALYIWNMKQGKVRKLRDNIATSPVLFM